MPTYFVRPRRPIGVPCVEALSPGPPAVSAALCLKLASLRHSPSRACSHVRVTRRVPSSYHAPCRPCQVARASGQ
eukprot:11158683-Lingulodinium_polyedra.AAC.1